MGEIKNKTAPRGRFDPTKARLDFYLDKTLVVDFRKFCLDRGFRQSAWLTKAIQTAVERHNRARSKKAA